MKPLTPTIINREAFKLSGLSHTFSFQTHQPELVWRSFMPRLKEISDRLDGNLYSVEVYPFDYFLSFDPLREFQKWAAVCTGPGAVPPPGLEVLHCPAGTYAVFDYQGPASEAPMAYQHIYNEWLPSSGYELADVPHMAIMPPGYRRDDPEAREEIWVPVRSK